MDHISWQRHVATPSMYPQYPFPTVQMAQQVYPTEAPSVPLSLQSDFMLPSPSLAINTTTPPFIWPKDNTVPGDPEDYRGYQPYNYMNSVPKKFDTTSHAEHQVAMQYTAKENVATPQTVIHPARQHPPIQHSAMKYSAMKLSPIQHPAMKHLAMQHPAMHHSAMQHPAIQKPARQHPTMQHPAMQHPAMQHRAMQHPAMQHPAMQQPAMQQPAMQHPTMQNPAMQNPTMQHPAMQHPAMQHPAMQQPAMQHPTMQNPTMQNPTMQHPAMQHPAMQHPAMQQPAMQHPTMQNPTMQHPAIQHTAAQPMAIEPRTMQYVDTQYAATQGLSTEHATTPHLNTQQAAAQQSADNSSDSDTPLNLSMDNFKKEQNYEEGPLDLVCRRTVSEIDDDDSDEGPLDLVCRPTAESTTSDDNISYNDIEDDPFRYSDNQSEESIRRGYILGDDVEDIQNKFDTIVISDDEGKAPAKRAPVAAAEPAFNSGYFNHYGGNAAGLPALGQASVIKYVDYLSDQIDRAINDTEQKPIRTKAAKKTYARTMHATNPYYYKSTSHAHSSGSSHSTMNTFNAGDNAHHQAQNYPSGSQTNVQLHCVLSITKKADSLNNKPNPYDLYYNYLSKSDEADKK